MLDYTHEYYMQIALQEAHKARKIHETPIGAIIVIDNQIIAKAHNQREHFNNPCGHAEIIAIKKAAKKINNWRLLNATLYVTVEPCIMCAGAILQSRIKCLIYGCKDPKAGAVHSLYTLLDDKRLNHQVEVISGVLDSECSDIIKDFFKWLRKTKS